MKSRRSRRLLMLLILALGALALGVAYRLASQPAMTSGPLPHDVYIWQRRWSPPVHESLAYAGPRFDSILVNAAEIEWREGRSPRIVRVRVDHAALKATGRPIGLVLRVGPYSGPFLPDDQVARMIVDLSAALLADARAAGYEPAELQIDFDAATSRLADYAVWVRAVREACAPVPLTITALPAWLASSDFDLLVQATDGFVLQVHAIVTPERLTSRISLGNPVLARQWVREAARAGVAFRVSLPTYGYRTGFDADGSALGIVAEGPEPDWPQQHVSSETRADPGDMAQLVDGWTRRRPQAMQGVIWFRMPIATDTRNWRWPTLESVMQGVDPQPDIRAAVAPGEGDIARVMLINDGAGDYLLDDSYVRVNWAEGVLQSAGAEEGFVVGSVEATSATILPDARHRGRIVPAGEALLVGYVQLAPPEAQVSVELVRVGR